MKIKTFFEQVDLFKLEADSLRPFKPERERIFWEKFRLEFNYNSNHLEGNTLTYAHTQLLLIFDKVSGDYTGREVEEMKNHDVALKIVKDSALDIEHILSEKFIKELNEIILVRPFYNEAITPDGQPTKRLIQPGHYKVYPNSVRLQNGEIFHYSNPEETPAQMGDLLDWYKKESEKRELHPVQIAALFHYRLVRIHPFDDSNGRTARLVMNYILMKNGYIPLVIESTDKRNYLSALNKADTGDLDAFVEYIVKISLKWQEIYQNALNGINIEEHEDLHKKIEILKKNISPETDVELKKSLVLIKDFTTNNLFPFLIFFEEQFSKLDSFFFEKEIFFHGSNLNRKLTSLRNIEQLFQEISRQLFEISSLNISFRHRELKKPGKRQWGQTTNVIIICKEFEYRIEFEDLTEKIKNPYRETLTSDDYSGIVDKIIRKLVAEIEKKLAN